MTRDTPIIRLLNLAMMFGDTDIREDINLDIRNDIFEADPPIKVVFAREHRGEAAPTKGHEYQLWLPGTVRETVYKSSTWDMIVDLECCKEVLVTEFFNKGSRSFIRWMPDASIGSEVSILQWAYYTGTFHLSKTQRKRTPT